MRNTAIVLWLFCLFLLAGPLAAQQEFIAYKLDGKEFRLTDVKLEYYPENYLNIEGAKRQQIDLGPNAMPRFQDAEAGIVFQISPQGPSFVGTHKGQSSDTLPVYVNWYDVVKEDNFTDIVTYTAGMDGGDPAVLSFTVTFENFGEEGTLIKGTFSGRLQDEDGLMHEVKDGRFAIERKNVK